MKELYEVCPHLLLLHHSYSDLKDQISDNLTNHVNIKGDPLLMELNEVVPNYLTKEHIETNHGILVEQPEAKYLGIIFDNALKFTSHINELTMKISKVVGILWKMRSIPLNIKLKVYFSLVYSHVNFAILIWGSDFSKNLQGITEFDHVPRSLKNLNTVHNKCIRALVCAKKIDPLSKIFRELNILKLVDIY